MNKREQFLKEQQFKMRELFRENVITKLQNPIGLIYILTDGYTVDFHCFHFSQILKAIYPESSMMYNGDHVVTKVGDKLYNHKGEVEDVTSYIPIVDYGVEHIEDLNNAKIKYYNDRYE